MWIYSDVQPREVSYILWLQDAFGAACSHRDVRKDPGLRASSEMPLKDPLLSLWLLCTGISPLWNHLHVCERLAQLFHFIGNNTWRMSPFCFSNTPDVPVVPVLSSPRLSRGGGTLANRAWAGPGRLFEWQSDLLHSPLLFLSSKPRKLDLQSLH